MASAKLSAKSCGPNNRPILRGHTQHGKVVGRNLDHFQMFGLFGTGQVCAARNDDTHIFEHIPLRSKIVEFRNGKPNAPQSYPWVVKVDPYKTVGVGERK